MEQKRPTLWGVSFCMLETNKQIRYLSYFLILLLIAVYYPGLQGGFHFDDYPNIVNNPRIHLQSLDPINLWQAAWSGQTNVTKRPLSVLSFALNTYFTGYSAPMMKITNLVIHMLNGLCIIYLSNLLLLRLISHQNDKKQAKYLSLLIGAIWMLHPLQLTCVLYVVQRMTSLATLFLLLATLSYCKVRAKQLTTQVSWLKFYPVVIFGSLSLLSKEIAVLIPLYLFCIEMFIFKFTCHSEKNKNSLYTMYVCTIIVPVFIGAVYLSLNPEWLAYSGRDFTLTERLMTEMRVVMGYLKAIIIPDIINMGLFSGDTYTISKSLLNPFTTLISGLTIVFALALGIYYRNNYAFLGFGIFWFFSGHALESTFIPLEIAFEHRNYLPSFGIIFAAIYGLFFYFREKNKVRIMTSLCIIFALTLGSVTFIRASYWASPISLALRDVQAHPNSVRANLTIGGFYQASYLKSQLPEQKQQLYEKALYYFNRAEIINPSLVTPIIARSIVTCMQMSAIPIDALESITKILKNNTFNTESELALIILTDRILDGTCKLSSDEYFRIVDAAISSKNLSNISESRLLFGMAAYHDKLLNDHDSALNLVKKAVKKSPNFLNYRIELINFYLAKGLYNEALTELKILEDRDKYGFNAASIKKAYTILESVSHSP